MSDAFIQVTGNAVLDQPFEVVVHAPLQVGAAPATRIFVGFLGSAVHPVGGDLDQLRIERAHFNQCVRSPVRCHHDVAFRNRAVWICLPRQWPVEFIHGCLEGAAGCLRYPSSESTATDVDRDALPSNQPTARQQIDFQFIPEPVPVLQYDGLVKLGAGQPSVDHGLFEVPG